MGRDAGPRDALSGEQLRARAREARRVFSALLAGAGFFVGAFLLGRLTLAFIQRDRPRRRSGAILGWDKLDPDLAALAPQARFYEELLEVMHRRRVPKPDWRPPGDHADSLTTLDPSLARVAAPLARLFYILRFGRRPLSPEEEAQLQRLLTSLRELSANRPSDRTSA